LGPSASYSIKHRDGWKVENFRISDFAYRRAQRGIVHFQGEISEKFRERIAQDFGQDPGPIDFEGLEFTKVRRIPASAKLPPRMRLSPTSSR
jgi:hypothetical protein